jgi:2,4-dienoyl-CoA reductase-like NADH-dependent reductase (Old Yellow Enzyme family)
LATFQKGAFTEEESLTVIKELDKLDIDFIEISGGSYEAPVMVKSPNTLVREAYFLKFAAQAKTLVKKTPLMVTGGFRTIKGIEAAIEEGKVDLVGLGRPLTVYPDLVKRGLQSFHLGEKKTGVSFIDAMVPLEITWYTEQIQRMGKKKKPLPNRNVWFSVFQSLIRVFPEVLERP